jgi:hypothetical protein
MRQERIVEVRTNISKSRLRKIVVSRSFMKPRVLGIIGLVLAATVGVAFSGSASAAPVWSSCQTITAVSNYLAYNNSIYLTLSPGISGCTGNGSPSVGFVVGQLGVTSDNIKSLLASALTALTSGSQVTVFYDDSTTPQCNSQIVAIKGYAAQCP